MIGPQALVCGCGQLGAGAVSREALLFELHREFSKCINLVGPDQQACWLNYDDTGPAPHFQLHHAALQTKCFVVFEKPDLTKPYVPDRAHRSSLDMYQIGQQAFELKFRGWKTGISPATNNEPPSRTNTFAIQSTSNLSDSDLPIRLSITNCIISDNIYQHPEYEADKRLCFYQVCSLMMVFTEIANLRVLEGAFQDRVELLSRKLERRQLVTSPDWNGAVTAKIFKYGFGFLEKDRDTLEQYSRQDVKGFYNRPCKLLALSLGN